MHIIAIVGSLRAKSHTRALVVEAQTLLGPDVTMTIAEIGDLPLYNEELDPADESTTPASVLRLRQQIREADAVLIATPEYNHAPPGVLKNALDWASRPFMKSALAKKPVAAFSVGGGKFSGVRALVMLRTMLTGCRMLIMPQPELVISLSETFKDGELADHKVRDNLREFVAALVVWAKR